MQEELDFNLKSALGGFVLDCREEVADKNSELKIWILTRKDLKLSTGKFGPQAAHAAGTCMVLTERKGSSIVDLYLSQGQAKIAVGVDGEADVVKFVEMCRAADLVAVMVQDAGRTELDGKTLTVGAVGPCLKSDLPGAVRRLQMYREPEA